MDIPKKILMTKDKIILEGGVYHITQRAPGRELLFLEKADFLKFLSLLKGIKKDFNLLVFCFALLSNHLHMLLRIKEKNLDKAMKKLFQSYALYFNKKYERKGHVFCGVYRASMCNSDDYLLAISLYIHLNAYKANIIKSPFLYKWHSLDVYIKPIKSTFIDREFILGTLSSDFSTAQGEYRRLMEGTSNLEYKNILEDKYAVRSFYNKFIKWMKEKFKNSKEDAGSLKNLFNLEKDIEKFMNKERVDKPEEKKAFKYLIEQLLSRGFSVREIAEKLNYDRSHIYRLIREIK